jgi:hypothetical protein
MEPAFPKIDAAFGRLRSLIVSPPQRLNKAGNQAGLLRRDPVMRQLVGRRGVRLGAASASGMGRFETAMRPSPRASRRSPTCPAAGSTWCTTAACRRSSRSTWTVSRASAAGAPVPEKGTPRPGILGGDRRFGCIEGQGGLIRAVLGERPDITVEELRSALAERGQPPQVPRR